MTDSSIFVGDACDIKEPRCSFVSQAISFFSLVISMIRMRFVRIRGNRNTLPLIWNKNGKLLRI